MNKLTILNIICFSTSIGSAVYIFQNLDDGNKIGVGLVIVSMACLIGLVITLHQKKQMELKNEN